MDWVGLGWMAKPGSATKTKENVKLDMQECGIDHEIHNHERMVSAYT